MENCNRAEQIKQFGKVVESGISEIIDDELEVVKSEAKYKLKEQKSFKLVLIEYFDGLLGSKLKDTLAPKLLSNAEIEYTNYMYDMLIKLVAKTDYMSIIFCAKYSGVAIKEICAQKNIDVRKAQVGAEAEAKEVFDILMVYENFVMKLLGNEAW